MLYDEIPQIVKTITITKTGTCIVLYDEIPQMQNILEMNLISVFDCIENMPLIIF